MPLQDAGGNAGRRRPRAAFTVDIRVALRDSQAELIGLGLSEENARRIIRRAMAAAFDAALELEESSMPRFDEWFHIIEPPGEGHAGQPQEPPESARSSEAG